jgi:hypothetical protein
VGGRQRVFVDELSKTETVATVLSLTGRRAVSVYQQRYPDLPGPVVGTSSQAWAGTTHQLG